MNEAQLSDATAFLDECRRAVRKLAAVDARLDDMADNGYMRAVSYDRAGGDGGPSDPTARSALSADALWDEARAAADRYAALLHAAQGALSAMEADGADADGDVALIDYYYLQAKSLRRCARLMGYSESYVRDKKALAVIHFAPYAPRDW